MDKIDDKWISVDKRTLRLVLRFRVKGYPKQFFISTGLKDSKRNKDIVRLKRDAIMTDIILDRFDSTLISYQFGVTKPHITQHKEEKKYAYTLLELWQNFTNYQETQIEQTTILNRYVAISRYTKKLPTHSLEECSSIRNWLLNHTTKRMVWTIINAYHQCCEWAVNCKLIPNNPFKNLKLKKPKINVNENYKAFTLEQRDLIIKVFETHSKFSHYASLIKFLFYTGCRPGEAFALTWNDISSDYCKVSINKSCNLHRIKKNTKNGISRVFTTMPGSKLQKLLEGMKPNNIDKNSLVFLDDNGKPMHSSTMQLVWKGVKSAKNYYPGVVSELADKGILPYLKPYSTRHTFATWAITQGVSPDKVALWIGDKVETVLRYYCHPNVVEAECPDI
jgi:integrase